MQGYVFDTTGQTQPPGAKPRVTATLWEDEGSVCYQVEARGVCVARRHGKEKKKKKETQSQDESNGNRQPYG